MRNQVWQHGSIRSQITSTNAVSYSYDPGLLQDTGEDIQAHVKLDIDFLVLLPSQQVGRVSIWLEVQS
jgi:hypothetical protein